MQGESSPEGDHRDLAALLLEKASGAAALQALAGATAVPDEIFGFTLAGGT